MTFEGSEPEPGDPQFPPDLEEKIISYVRNELKRTQMLLKDERGWRESHDDEVKGGKDQDQRWGSKEAVLNLTVNILREMDQEKLASTLQTRSSGPVCQQKLKSGLKQKFQCLRTDEEGNRTHLNQIYTEQLHITELRDPQVGHIERASRKQDRAERSIRPEDIFTGSAGTGRPNRTVLTKGAAGTGKTLLTQKFTLDWAEDKANQDVDFMFPFTFRELNVLKEQRFSLVQLIHRFFPESEVISSFQGSKVMFIFDGLDECRLPLDFHTKRLTDVTESTSVDDLLTNLIRGNLLPSAHLWITTRLAAANQIPPQYVTMETEVRGFTDPQKDEYFRKRFRDEQQSNRIISHIKTSRSLHSMCHNPGFCRITAVVLEDQLKTREGGMTRIYIHHLLEQIKSLTHDETGPHWSPDTRRMLASLGKLGLEQRHRGNVEFDESDMTKCGIEDPAASVDSGLVKQTIQEETGLHRFSFVHPSVQDVLAALHVHLTSDPGVNPLSDKESTSVPPFYQSCVDQALVSPKGAMDLFPRFLLGLSLQNNQTLLRGLMTQTGSGSETKEETVQYIKKKLSENPSAERSIILFHCLNELNDGSVVEQIQQNLRSGRLSTREVSPAQWSSLVFILLSSGDLDEFDLKSYSGAEEVLLGLVPVVSASSKALLSSCNLSGRSCEALASVLTSSSLRELDLSHNDLQDSGVKLLSAGLKSPNCQIRHLRLSSCNLSERSCEVLASVLSLSRQLDPSHSDLQETLSLKQQEPDSTVPHRARRQSIDTPFSFKGSEPEPGLRDLDLSHNDLQDSGVELLSAGLKSPNCRLETLSLSGCGVADEGCASLASALASNPTHLRELDLSYNRPGAKGRKLLFDGVKDRIWRLETLRLDHGDTQTLRTHFCELSVDTNTVNTNIKLSDNNRTMTYEAQHQPYPPHPDRFINSAQLLCGPGLSGRSSWEVQWTGSVSVTLSYRGVRRRSDSSDLKLGRVPGLWSLTCSDGGYRVCGRDVSRSMSSDSDSGRVAVFLDWPAGSLSFYEVSSDKLHLLHTFTTTFNEPLYAGFGFWDRRPGSSMSLLPRERV